VFAGAVVHGATGFGFALVAAPVLVAVLGPREAVGAVMVLAVVLNAATLRRRPQVLAREAAGLLAWALPGLALGAVAFAALPEDALAAVVCVAVLAGVAARRLPDARPWPVPASGLAAGALTTSTGTNGPPLVLALLGRGARPEQVRDTLAVMFLVLGVAGAIVLLAAGELVLPGALATLVVALLAGQEAGRRLFARLDARRYEAVLLVVLAGAAVASGASAVA
jgi:uncharacterized membrane protein YfcA